MEACFSFGDDAAFHFIGLYASEHDYHGRSDEAGTWTEVAKRFIPTAYAEGCVRVAPWFAEKTAGRLRLDAAIRDQLRPSSERDRQKPDSSTPEERQPQTSSSTIRPAPALALARAAIRAGHKHGDPGLAKAGWKLLAEANDRLSPGKNPQITLGDGKQVHEEDDSSDGSV
jgi:hypothetical protein